MAVNTMPPAANSGTPMKAPNSDEVANGPTQNTSPHTTGTVSIHLKINRAGSSLRLRQRHMHHPMTLKANASSTIPRTIS
jgi:hypothetical protein